MLYRQDYHNGSKQGDLEQQQLKKEDEYVFGEEYFKDKSSQKI